MTEKEVEKQVFVIKQVPVEVFVPKEVNVIR